MSGHISREKRRLKDGTVLSGMKKCFQKKFECLRPDGIKGKIATTLPRLGIRTQD
jgi:hypothetical protein